MKKLKEKESSYNIVCPHCEQVYEGTDELIKTMDCEECGKTLYFVYQMVGGMCLARIPVDENRNKLS